MRLINADKLSEAIHENVLAMYEESVAAKEDCLREIEEAPTVDAVVVTRCKDCKYAYINSFSASSGVALCTLSGKPMQQDDFCSYGEPKEG